MRLRHAGCVVGAALAFVAAVQLLGACRPSAPSANDEPTATLVLMTHPASARHEFLCEILGVYAGYTSVARVIVVLNGGMKRLPPHGKPLRSEKLRFVAFESNAMSNRFLVFEHVGSDAVLVLDDDLLLSDDLIRFMARELTAEPDRVIGLDFRAAVGARYRMRGPEVSSPYSSAEGNIVIGGSMMFHRKFLRLFASDTALLRWVSPPEPHYCEDIAMTALITNATGKAPLLVRPNERCWRVGNAKLASSGLSRKPKSWALLRDECVAWTLGHFSGFAFLPSDVAVQCGPQELGRMPADDLLQVTMLHNHVNVKSVRELDMVHAWRQGGAESLSSVTIVFSVPDPTAREVLGGFAALAKRYLRLECVAQVVMVLNDRPRPARLLRIEHSKLLSVRFPDRRQSNRFRIAPWAVAPTVMVLDPIKPRWVPESVLMQAVRGARDPTIARAEIPGVEVFRLDELKAHAQAEQARASVVR